VRSVSVLAALATLAACGSDVGKGAGETCGSAAECARGLVCFERACAAGYPAAVGCSGIGTPQLVVGGMPVVTEPAPGACVTEPSAPVPFDGFVDLGVHPVGTALTFTVPPGTASLTIHSQEFEGSAVDQLVLFGSSFPNTVVPTDVRLPDGRLLFSDTDALPVDPRGYDDVTGVLAYYGGATPVAGSFTVPNTAAALDLVRTAGELPAGTWSFTVNDWAHECATDSRLVQAGCRPAPSGVPYVPGSYQIRAHAKPGPLASTGTLDLEVYLVTDRTDPAGPLPDAEAAVAHPAVARWVRVLSSYFANAGICLGTVTIRDVPGWVRDRYAPNGSVDISGAGLGLTAEETPVGCDDLSQLFTVATVATPAVHLFLADDLFNPNEAGLGTVLGIDGSIPGPSGVPGTVNGGAIIALFGFLGFPFEPGACDAPAGNFGCGTDVLSYVAAHEAGHWLGLYHTTEWHGTTFDPLSDTATCPCLRCAGPDDRPFCAERGARDPTPMDSAFCAAPAATGPALEAAARAAPALSCGGARNLMFWQFDPTFAEGRLSREQGDVMRLNPAVR
jgi:hypothetical protein